MIAPFYRQEQHSKSLPAVALLNLFGRYTIGMSAGSPTVLGFLQAYTDITHRNRPQRLSLESFFVHHTIRYLALQSIQRS
jgi:hypothetical protein